MLPRNLHYAIWKICICYTVFILIFTLIFKIHLIVSNIPAVGQYDISKKPFDSAGAAVHFSKEKRFKEPGSLSACCGTLLLLYPLFEFISCF